MIDLAPTQISFASIAVIVGRIKGVVRAVCAAAALKLEANARRRGTEP